MNRDRNSWWSSALTSGLTVFLAVSSILALTFIELLVAPSSVHAQDRGTPFGEWRYWGADAWSTRYSPLDQIDANNFGDLEQAWLWRGDNFGPSLDYILRSTPIYVGGRLFTVAGQSRTVSALDPATGEVLWMFREPHTTRWERSSRKSHGKGVAYHEVDGRGVIYLVTPAFFLHALDAETGLPLEGFGAPVPLDGFDETGTVDLLEGLGHPYDPDYGIPDSIGYITNTSPPIVVNGVVVIGNSNLTGRLDPREENVPGDILAYDARTGEHLWKFNVIPRPGEFGHETWESDAWQWSGNVNAWAPMSADPELGIVYVTTDAPTNDYFGGFRPGDNLFGNSIIALDVRTGERLWHFQGVHHDVWDRDFPLPPTLVDLTVDGERIPALVQNSKQAFVYAFNRVTGEPIWPIEERQVPQSDVPSEQTSPTQPYPTRPAAFEMQGLTEDDLINFTPVLRSLALEIASEWQPRPHVEPTPSLGKCGWQEGRDLLPLRGRRGEHSRRRGDGPRDGDHVRGVGEVVLGLRARSRHRQGRGVYRSIGPDRRGLAPLPGAGRFSWTRGSPDVQTSVRAYHRHRHEHRRTPLVDSQRRHTGADPEPSQLARTRPAQHGAGLSRDRFGHPEPSHVWGGAWRGGPLPCCGQAHR